MATYYVNGSTGSDKNAGTSTGTALKTIQAGVSKLSAGDTLEVAAGTYFEQVVVSANGTSGNRITIRPATGETVTVTGRWPHDTLPNYSSSAIKPNGIHQSLVFVTGDYVTIEDIIIIDSAARALFVTGDYVEIKNVSIRWCLNAGIGVIDSHGTLIEDTEVGWAGRLKKQYGKEWAEWSGKDNIITNWPHICGPIHSTNLTMRRVTVHDSGGEGIHAYRSKNTLVEDCISYNNASTQYYSNFSGTGTIFRRCIGYLTESYEYGGNPSAFEVRDEHEVENRNLPHYGPSNGTKIQNCLFVNCYPHAIDIGGPANLVNYEIANNTFIARQNYKCIQISRLSSSDSHPRARSGTKIYNNIFYGDSLIQDASGVTFSNNIWYPKVPANVSGVKQLGTNPQLVDALANIGSTINLANYKLQSNSPARSAGIPVSGLDTDYFGASRSSTPDIGFHEYGGVSSPVVTAAFSASNETPDVGESVTLTDGSTITEGAIDAYLWQVSLDNGQTKTTIATTQNTTYTPTSNGSHLILLTATDADSGESSVARLVLDVGTVIVNPEDPGDEEEDTGDFSCSGNLLTNPSFDTNTTGWAASNISLSRAVDPLDSSGYVGKIHTFVSGTNEVRQSGFAVTSGATYTFSFNAWTDDVFDRVVVINLIDHLAFNHLADPQYVTITQSKTRYTLSIACDTSSSNARIRFSQIYLFTGAAIYIDDICLRPYSEVAASFTVSDSSPSLGDTITLTDTSTGSPYAWSWRVTSTAGLDEVISTAAGPVDWAIPGPGEYTIKLTVAGGDNTDYATTSITVSPKPDWFQSGLRRALRKGLP